MPHLATLGHVDGDLATPRQLGNECLLKSLGVTAALGDRHLHVHHALLLRPWGRHLDVELVSLLVGVLVFVSPKSFAQKRARE